MNSSRAGMVKEAIVVGKLVVDRSKRWACPSATRGGSGGVNEKTRGIVKARHEKRYGRAAG